MRDRVAASQSADAAELWAELAAQHDGKDRWYLEALGIGADEQWDKYFSAWLSKVGREWNTPAGRDIVWRSRATETPALLAKMAAADAAAASDLPRFMRAFDFLSGTGKDEALVQLAFATTGDPKNASFVSAEAITRLKGFDVNSQPEYKAALNKILDGSQGSVQFVKLVDKFNVQDRYPALLAMAQAAPDQQVGVEAIRTLLNKNQRTIITGGLDAKKLEDAERTAIALRYAADGRSNALLRPFLNNKKAPSQVRREAVRALAKTRPGAQLLAKLATEKKIDATLLAATAAALHTAQARDIREQAAKLFPLPPTKGNKPLPPISELVKRKGDIARGKKFFETTGTCAKCHIVNKQGKEVGPNLTEIGSKLSRQAFFESIIYPSAGIAHNYETYVVRLENGDQITGILTSDTAASITIKDKEALARTIPKDQIDDMKKQTVSLMPADLQKIMTEQDLVDVVDYLMTLKKK